MYTNELVNILLLLLDDTRWSQTQHAPQKLKAPQKASQHTELKEHFLWNTLYIVVIILCDSLNPFIELKIQKPVTFEPQKRQRYTGLEDPNVHVVFQRALHQKTS